MPRFEPKSSALSTPFWDATRDCSLLYQRCTSCQSSVWYPRLRCPACMSDALEWRQSSGKGTVYSFNIMRVAGNPMMANDVPYVVALVDLDEGHRMLTNITGCDPSAVTCGQRVSVTWDVELSDGRRLPTFRPDAV